MKRLALVAAVLVVAACSTKETPKADTAAPAMAPAPAAAPADTGMKMDSASMKMDTAAAKMDTAAKKMDSAVQEEAVSVSHRMQSGAAHYGVPPRFDIPASLVVRRPPAERSGTPVLRCDTGGFHPSSRRASSEREWIVPREKVERRRRRRVELVADDRAAPALECTERGTRHDHRNGDDAQTRADSLCRALEELARP